MPEFNSSVPIPARREGTPGRHEPPDLLGRPSLHFAEMSMHNTSNVPV